MESVVERWNKPEETREKSIRLLGSFILKQLEKLESINIDFKANEVTIKMRK